MTVDILAIQQGLANAADNITGLRAFASIPDTLNPPVFAVIEFDADYHQTFGSAAAGGLTEFLFTCGVFVSSGDTFTGRKALVAYLSPDGTSSIRAALSSDRTLGGVCQTLMVESVTGAFRLYEVGGTFYLGANYTVRVWA